MNSTLPVGVPLLLVTVVVSVMLLPESTGFALEVRLVAVANRVVVIWVSGLLVLVL